MEKKVDFFIVGFQKTGTSSLANYLNESDKIKVLQEPNYFCKDFHKESSKYHKHNKFYNIRNETDYFNLFKDIDSNVLLGDKSPNYLYSRVAAEQIYNHNPNAKIIIMIRDPLNFLTSWHNHAIKMGHENQKNIIKSIRLEKKRKKLKKIPKACKQPSFLYYSEMIKFEEQIKRYVKLFPVKNIKVVIFEDFVKNTKKEVQNILSFLEVDDDFFKNYKFENKNPGKSPRNLFLQQFIRNPNLRIKKIISKIISQNQKKKIYSFFMKLNSKDEKIEVSEKDKKYLRNLTQIEAKKVNELLNKKGLIREDLLKKWKYK
ncbi:MAG: sulfotransferase family protein [Candidatus Nanoarchaeia archaeon]